MPTYTYAQFISDLNGKVRGRQADLKSTLNTANQAVREVLARLDLRGTKRKTTVSPGLFDDVFSYAWPTDAKDQAFIDLNPQVNRTRMYDWELITPEEFYRRSYESSLIVAVNSNDSVSRLLASIKGQNDDSVSISTLDSLTAGGGTWQAFGDAENVVADADNYVMSNGSIKFDISSAGGTTAGIYNDSLDTIDISDYVDNNRSIFYFAYITSPTNITNYKIRIGSSASAYYEMTATATQENIAFHVGWNLLRFDFASKTTTGTPVDTAVDYCAIYMTKAGAKVSETAYRFDHIIMRGGVIHDLYYYSQYGWQTSAGVWIENSTTTTDLLNMDTEEYQIALDKFSELASDELGDEKAADKYAKKFEAKARAYELKNPSEAKILITGYKDFSTWNDNSN